MANKALRGAALCAVILMTASCATTPEAGDVRDNSPRVAVEDPTVSEAPIVPPANSPESSSNPADQVVLGTGQFVQSARGPERTVFAGDDGVTLNFENAELHEFLRAVFDTILKQNYIVDPSVGGTVTLHTTRPITLEAVLPTVEAVLQLNGAAMLYDDGAYRIMPLADAAQSSRSPSIGRYSSNQGVGYGIQVVPLQFASATEIEKILTPYRLDPEQLMPDSEQKI